MIKYNHYVKKDPVMFFFKVFKIFGIINCFDTQGVFVIFKPGEADLR